MAGIGFVLRKLFRKNTLSSACSAYFHAMMATSGAWIFTVIGLGVLYLLTKDYSYYGYIDEFRAINLYNFCFSLVFTAPFTIIATRYLADGIYQRDLSSAMGMLVGNLGLAFLISTPFVFYFYFYYAELSQNTRIMAVIQYYLITSIWISSVFISTLKYYKGVSISFLIGMAIGVTAALQMASMNYTTAGILLGFSLGLVVILSSILALIFNEYPSGFKDVFAFTVYFRKHWELAVGGLFYSLGIWIDKWIMWFSPDSITLPSKIILYPYYDSAMFVSYLTVIPVMAMFIMMQETSFFELYVKYYGDIEKHSNFKQIQSNQLKMEECIGHHGRNLVMMQGCICVMTILVAPSLFEIIGMNNVQLGMFKFGVMGASFHVMSLLLLIILSYFEDRKSVLLIQMYFFISNGVFTYITMNMGFSFYGYGYFLSTLTTFVFAAVELRLLLNRLGYHTFITTNESLFPRG